MEKYIGVQGFKKTDVIMTDNPEEALSFISQVIPETGKDFTMLVITSGSTLLSYEVGKNDIYVKSFCLN